MKNNRFKKFTLLILALLLTFSITACLDPAEDGSDVETITVSMNILYPDTLADEDGEEQEVEAENIRDFKMQVENSATILQILQSFADQEGITLQVSDSGETVYVTSINDIAEGKSSGWIYEVNGEASLEDCSNYVPKNGDEITWEYIKF